MENTDHVCAWCENTGTITDTEGLVWQCPYQCHEDSDQISDNQ